jgi:hypothetical protein
MSTRQPIRVLVFCALAFFIGASRADTWSFEAKSSDRAFSFGATRIVLTTDARGNRQYPDFILKVFRDKELRAQYRGVAFDQVFASPDNGLFLGLSTAGIPGTAVVLFDKDGNLRLLATHGLAEFEYCSKSVTVSREWYDEKNPQVRFALESSGKEQGIFLRDCKGRTVELLDTVQKAYNRAFDQTRAETARAGQRGR